MQVSQVVNIFRHRNHASRSSPEGRGDAGELPGEDCASRGDALGCALRSNRLSDGHTSRTSL